jgi:hypothetical protein
MSITITSELTNLAMEVDLADRALGMANARLNEFRSAHPQYSGQGTLLRFSTDSPLDQEHRIIQENLNHAQKAFALACKKYADAKP